MSSSTASAALPGVTCPVCYAPAQATAKFCGNCGALSGDARTASPQPVVGTRQMPTVPAFAPVAPRAVPGAIAELREEQAKLLILLVRERLFLYLHWLGFLSTNLFGIWLALKCYNEYLGDEMTRLMMASTPLLYINLLTLLFLLPIKGTRREIARLKERLNYSKFQMEYNHLL